MSQFRENISAIAQAAREDLHESNLRDRAVVLATMGGLVVHELTMETWVAKVGTEVLTHTQSNPWETGAAMGLLSGVVETVMTYATAETIEKSPRATTEIINRYFSDKIDSVKQKSVSGRAVNAINTAAIGITLGSPGIIFYEYQKNPDRSKQENIRTGLRARTALAAMNFSLGAVVGGSAWISEKLGTHDVTDAVSDVARWPYLTWSILGGLVLGRVGARFIKSRSKSISQSEVSEEGLSTDQGLIIDGES